MTFVWVAVGVTLVIIWGLTISDIVRRHLGGGKTAAWLLIVVLLPFAGALLYWILRRSTPEELQQQADAGRGLRERSRFDRPPQAPR
jgi:hypothetical protein